ncbi:MAG TPA: ABC transporter permease [Thermoleophilaceae bacterium]|jgi:simple sugar transport system permease protein|nr:ABC transporter permease [Thermoleophilaceae bacterium]
MSGGVFTTLFALGVALAAPLLWAALGELIIEQSGVLNIGIEGVMLIGAFGCAYAYVRSGSMVAGIATAMGCGAACGLVLALLYVRLGADQIVTGILFSVIALAGTTVLADRLLGTDVAEKTGQLDIPGLSEIPFFGTVLFSQDPLVYAAIVAVPLVSYLMSGTWFGLYVRAIGARPRAGETAGIGVRALRTWALVIGCVLTAIGGASLVVATSGGFSPNLTAGRGFIALAVVVLARWKPLWAAAAALLFGVAQALQFVADELGFLAHVPSDVLLMLPYLLTVVAVVFAAGSRYPAACGVPYRPGSA